MLIGAISVISVIVGAVGCLQAGAFESLMWLWLLPVGSLGCFLALGLAYFLLLWISCAVVRLDKPQLEDNRYYRLLVQLTAEAAITVLRVRVHTKGLEKTPKEGRFLLVCNHLNDMDPVTLMWFFRKSQLAFNSKRENSSMFLVGKLMHKTLCQPINRENDREALKTILRCIDILKNDQASVAVFPEGYTSMDEKLHPFRSGVFKIAQKAQVPIVVCTLQNTQYVFRNALRLKRTDVHLHLLDVIPAEELKGVTAVDIGNRVHAMMAEDLGPENVLQPEKPENT